MRHVVTTANAPAAIGPYSQAIRTDKLLFLSGQIGLDPTSGQLVGPGVGAQTHQVLANMKAVLETAGVGFSGVVKTTIFLTDLGDFAEVNQIYANYVGDVPPARSTVQVAALPRGAKVEIEAIAVL